MDTVDRMRLRLAGDRHGALVGSEAGYVARSEGVKSLRVRQLARDLFTNPGEAEPDRVRTLAAAILAFHQYGK